MCNIYIVRLQKILKENKIKKRILTSKKAIFHILNKLSGGRKEKHKNPKRDYLSDGRILNKNDMCMFYRKIYGMRLEIHNFVIPKILEQGGDVLEIACGTGLNYDRLRYYPTIRRYIGIDTSLNALNYAKDLYGEYFIRCDGQKTPFRNHEFDVSFALSVADHLDNYKNLLEEMIRLTKKMVIIVLYQGLTDKENIKKYKIDAPERLKYIIDSYKRDKDGNYIYFMNQYSKADLIKYIKKNFTNFEYKINNLPSYDPKNHTNADALILTKKPYAFKKLR